MTSLKSAFGQQKAREKAYGDEIHRLTQGTGIEDAAIDYAAFLRLTTFGPDHLGEGGMYSLHMDGAQVVGIRSGPGAPPFYEGYEDIEMQAMADHQRNAHLDFPTTIRGLLSWVFTQTGDVELAIEGSDQYPVEPADWVDAAMSATALAGEAPVLPREKNSIQRMGGAKRNEANAVVRAKILEAYKAGGYVSKNAATEELAKRFNRSPSTVRRILVKA